MTYVEAIQAVVESLGMKFIHADPYEMNKALDDVELVEYPVFVLIAPRKPTNKIDGSGMIHRRVPIRSFILFHYDEDTVESNKVDLKATVALSITYADRIIGLINKHAVTSYTKDPDNGINDNGVTEYDTDETYAKADGNLYGNALNFWWPVNEGIRSCV